MKIRAVIRSVFRHNQNAITIILDQVPKLKYLAGQFIIVTVEIDGELLSRSYSLSSTDDEDDSPAITVKRVKDGVVSNYLVDNAEELQYLMIEGPFGTFVYDGGSKTGNDIVLVAGGSGISPILSILKHVLKNRSNNILLILCNKSIEETIYRHLINRLSNEYKDRLKVHHFLSQEQGCHEDNMHAGRISRLSLKKLVKQFTNDYSTADFFVCGPEGLIDLTKGTIESLSVHKENFHTESFWQEPLVNVNAAPVEVLFNTYGSIRLIEVKPNVSLLQAALEERIEVRYSCRSGNCGMCVAKKESGKVQMTNNYALDQSQVDEGLILLCQSYPLDNDVSVLVS